MKVFVFQRKQDYLQNGTKLSTVGNKLLEFKQTNKQTKQNKTKQNIDEGFLCYSSPILIWPVCDLCPIS